MATTDTCQDRIKKLRKAGMRFADDTTALCKGIEALSDQQFGELLQICGTMNNPSGQPYLGYGFGFQNRAGED